MDALKLIRDETGASKRVPITHLMDATTVELDNGQIGCTVMLAGVPFDTANNSELNQYKCVWHHALSVLGDQFCVVAHTLRRKLDIQLDGQFKDDFTEQVNTAYHQRFREHSVYANQLTVTVLYQGLSFGKWAKPFEWFQRMRHQTIKHARVQHRQQARAILHKAVQKWMSMLADFKPRLIGTRDEMLGHSELLAFYGSLINGLDEIPFKAPVGLAPVSLLPIGNGFRVQKGLRANREHSVRYPQGRIAPYLCAKRLFFGEYIEFRGSPDHSHFAAMLSLKSYGADTAPNMLDTLLQLDCECLVTNTFAITPNEAAHSTIVKQLIRLDNAGDAALSQQDALTQCRDDLASGRLRVGLHHHSVMLVSADLLHLTAMVNKAIKLYSDIGFVAIQETLGLEPAFWAQLPGNQRYIVRSSLIASQNFVDFFPLHNYRTGYRDRNHLGSAVTVIETPSKTPMFFNFHAKGSGDKNDLTPGHTTIIGGNGSGKTVFMGFMDSQMGRYGGRSFFFDRDRGMEIYVRAAGGVYARISPDCPADSQFNPFCLDDTPTNRAFLTQWLAQLVKQEHEDELPAAIGTPLAACVDYAYEALLPEHRNLHTVTRLLPIDFPRWDRVNQWLRGDEARPDGAYAYLFDNATDRVHLNANKCGFDFTELFNQPTSVMTAVCMYLMHRVKQSLDGQRVSLYFDEGWQLLDNAYWTVQLKKDLPTLRKLNAHIILATQSPESVVNSALSAQFLDNCATHIFFCNPTANFEKHYQQFHVTHREFEFIKHTPRELRLFLYKQAEESAICTLNLSGMEDALSVYSANKSTLTILDAVRKECGDSPAVWLPEFHRRRTLSMDGALL